MDKVADTFGIKTPKHVEMKQNGNPVYRGRRAVAKGAGIAGRWIENRKVGAPIRTIDSAVQQHRINQVTRGAAFGDDSALTERRDELDSRGTVQSKTGHIDHHRHITRRGGSGGSSS